MEANQSIIKKAYHKKAREKHPIRGGLGGTGAFQGIRGSISYINESV